MATVRIGTSGTDVINGSDGEDRIYGLGGNDSLRGWGGADTFVFAPGHGNDYILDFEVGVDTVDLSGFVLSHAVTWDDLKAKMTEKSGNLWGDNYVEIDLTEWGGGKIYLYHIKLDQLDESMFIMPSSILEGGDGDDTLIGANGVDFITGGDGDDIIDGHGGNDMLSGNQGVDVISGHDGSDTIRGGQGDDVIIGGRGDDHLYGNGQSDGEGSDKDTFVYTQGDGHDTIYDFTSGEDKIDLTAFDRAGGLANLDLRQDGDNVIIDMTKFGGGTITLSNVKVADLDEDDFIFRKSATFEGTDAFDILVGTAGSDIIKGHGNIDFIMGGQGDDRIEGGSGNDFLYGDGISDDGTGSDRDTFVYTPGGGYDTIVDFTDGEDKIDVTSFNGIAGMDDIEARQDGNNVVIDFTDQGAGTVTLMNFTLSDLDANDFLF